jgi:inner membrane protein involved in colicin E2 resistance
VASWFSRWIERRSDRAFFVGMGLIALLLVALYPVAAMVDERSDRQRDLYNDVASMIDLQKKAVVAKGQAVPVTVAPDSTVKVGGTKFTSSPGVEIVVELRDDGFCVRGNNTVGDVTRWQCVMPGEPAIVVL